MTGGGATGAADTGGAARVGRRAGALSEHSNPPSACRAPCQQLGERREQPAALQLVVAAPGEALRQRPEGLGDAVARRDLGDHLAVVGGGAEQLRLEGDDRLRLVLDRPREVGRP